MGRQLSLLVALTLLFAPFTAEAALAQNPTDGRLAAEVGERTASVEAVPARRTIELESIGPPPDVQPVGVITGSAQGPQGQPLASVQVYIPDLDLGALTRQNGRYLLQNVPEGTHTLVAERIGYQTVTVEVTVGAQETVVQDFTLEQEALALDEIVVTGTAGQARRRELGNSISQIRTEEEVVAPPLGVEEMLQGRVPGMSITMTSGVVGDGADIRLRGAGSSALSNAPLIYVDGVRIQGDRYDLLAPTTLGTQYSHQARPSPLQDLNPENIERIEVIKGAAATTLYGTEASTGVVQIFTKRGRTGEPQWNSTIESGVNLKNFFGVKETLRGTPTDDFPQLRRSVAGGSVDYMYLDPWMRDRAFQQRYATSVRGQAGSVQYFVSGVFEDNEDLMVRAGQQRYGARGNVGVDLLDELHLEWNTSYNRRNINNIGCGDDFYGVCSRASYGGIIDVPKEEYDFYLDKTNRTEIAHLTTGSTLRFQPMDNFSARLVAGYDRTDNVGTTKAPFGFPRRPGGFHSVTDILNELFTLDFVSNYSVDLTSSLTSQLTAGFQRISRSKQKVEGWTEGFPGPGEATLSSGAVSLAREERLRVITGGVFGQALFGLHDRYFLTLGLRVDGNSAFGQDFGWEPYPKVSGSWVVSDEAFWPEQYGQLKLRAAYGFAGRAPDAFDAVRTWTSTPWNDEASFDPSQLGNPELGPETTAELELGFDGSTLDDRLTVEFTWYRQVTTDALLALDAPPSSGNWSDQLFNLGEIENDGFEVAVTGTPIRTRDYLWELGASVSTNDVKIVDMGGAPETRDTKIGHPAQAVWGERILNPDEIADPEIDDDHIYGPINPDLLVNAHTTVRLPYGILVTARGEFQGGHYVNDGASEWAMREGNDEYPPCWDALELMDQGSVDQLTAREKALCTRNWLAPNAWVYPADFFKLRELSVRFPVSRFIPAVSDANLTLAGRNLYRWVKDDWEAYDPESAGGWTVGNGTSSSMWQRPSPPMGFTATLRVTH